MSGAAGRCRDLVRSNFFRVIVSDVCTLIALVLILISVAVGSAKPTDNFSWAKFDVSVPNQDYDISVNFGLTNIVECALGTCVTRDLGIIKNNNCKVGGQGVITAATFGMVFGLLTLFFFHVDLAGKQLFGRTIRFPRVFLNLFSFLSLVLYIVVVATWYNRCYNSIGSIVWTFTDGNDSETNTPTRITAGYAIATSIAAIVFSFFAWAFAFWRTCSPNKNEPVRAPKVKAPLDMNGSVNAAGPMSPNASATPYTQQASSSNLGKVAGADDGSNAYGSSAYSNGNGSTYGNDDANDTPSAGYTSGGYGSGAGAYGSSAYGSNKQESAYGY